MKMVEHFYGFLLFSGLIIYVHGKKKLMWRINHAPELSINIGYIPDVSSRKTLGMDGNLFRHRNPSGKVMIRRALHFAWPTFHEDFKCKVTPSSVISHERFEVQRTYISINTN